MGLKLVKSECPDCRVDTENYTTLTCPECSADKEPIVCPDCGEGEVYTDTKHEPTHTKVFAVCYSDECVQNTLGAEAVSNLEQESRTTAEIAMEVFRRAQ